MTVGRLLGTVVVTGAMVLAACGDVAEEADSELPTTEAATPSTTAGAPATTAAPENLETGEGTMIDETDPLVPLAGGNVGLSHPGDTYPAELAGVVSIAVKDLAQRLGIDRSSVNVVSVEEVTWSDASLGCPDPDMSYAQVITDGLRILLESEGSVYDYRSGGMTDPFLCEHLVAKDDTPAATFEITPDGDVVPVTVADKNSDGPSEGNNPPDE